MNMTVMVKKSHAFKNEKFKLSYNKLFSIISLGNHFFTTGVKSRVKANRRFSYSGLGPTSKRLLSDQRRIIHSSSSVRINKNAYQSIKLLLSIGTMPDDRLRSHIVGQEAFNSLDDVGLSQKHLRVTHQQKSGLTNSSKSAFNLIFKSLERNIKQGFVCKFADCGNSVI